MAGRDYVVPDDLSFTAVPVLAHRLLLAHQSSAATRREVLTRLLAEVPVPD